MPNTYTFINLAAFEDPSEATKAFQNAKEYQPSFVKLKPGYTWDLAVHQFSTSDPFRVSAPMPMLCDGRKAGELSSDPEQKPAITSSIIWDGSDESSAALLAMGAKFYVQESCPPFLTILTPGGKLGARVGDTITKAADGSFAVLKAPRYDGLGR